MELILEVLGGVAELGLHALGATFSRHGEEHFIGLIWTIAMVAVFLAIVAGISLLG